MRMTKKRTDALIELRANDVFEFASMRVGFRISDGERVGEQALGEATAAHDVARAVHAVSCK